MKGLMLSKDVRDYLKEREHIFSDSEKATLIYNSDWFLPEKHEALSELGNWQRIMLKRVARNSKLRRCLYMAQHRNGMRMMHVIQKLQPFVIMRRARSRIIRMFPSQ